MRGLCHWNAWLSVATKICKNTNRKSKKDTHILSTFFLMPSTTQVWTQSHLKRMTQSHLKRRFNSTTTKASLRSPSSFGCDKKKPFLGFPRNDFVFARGTMFLQVVSFIIPSLLSSCFPPSFSMSRLFFFAKDQPWTKGKIKAGLWSLWCKEGTTKRCGYVCYSMKAILHLIQFNQSVNWEVRLDTTKKGVSERNG